MLRKRQMLALLRLRDKAIYSLKGVSYPKGGVVTKYAFGFAKRTLCFWDPMDSTFNGPSLPHA